MLRVARCSLLVGCSDFSFYELSWPCQFLLFALHPPVVATIAMVCAVLAQSNAPQFTPSHLHSWWQPKSHSTFAILEVAQNAAVLFHKTRNGDDDGCNAWRTQRHRGNGKREIGDGNKDFSSSCRCNRLSTRIIQTQANLAQKKQRKLRD